jgi:hypothetical protein
MPNPVDPIALYGALAAVAAITTALQTTAAFASYADVGAIEGKFDASRPSTQERTNAIDDAKASLGRASVLNVPGVVVNGCVIAAWGDVTLVRAQADWVLILPWVGVLLTFLFLFFAVISLHERLTAVHEQTRNPTRNPS